MEAPSNITVENQTQIACQTFKINFPDFEKLDSTRKGFNVVRSPEIRCFGLKWNILLYPGGDDDSRKGMVGLFLESLSAEERVIDLELKVIHRDGSRNNMCEGKVLLGCKFFYSGQCCGFEDFMRHSKVCKLLNEGTLTIEVCMNQLEGTGKDQSLEQFTPPNPFPLAMCKTFNDERSSDVLFVVNVQDVKGNGRKKSKMTPSYFHAHRLILRKAAPDLYDICEPYKDKTPVPIDGTEPEIFGCLLQYTYGGSIPEKKLKSNLRDIIDAADKYGVVGLKLEAEALYVKSTTFTTDNVIENLLYADSKNCALLNEAAVDFMVENEREVQRKINFENIPGRIVPEILAAVARGRGTSYWDRYRVSSMCVSSLRRLCHMRGEKFDGSRKTMIADLEKRNELSDLEREKYRGSETFVAPNPFHGAMLKTFNDEESADVLFVVDKNPVTKVGNEKKETPPMKFHAHLLILKECAPKLANLCQSYEAKKPVPICGVEPTIFGHLMKYVYGGSIPEKDLKENAKDIIDLSYRYGVVGLKIEAEVYYVNSISMNMDNVAQNLHYANSKKCALLKEAVVDFIVKNENEVLEKVSFDNVPGIAREILTALARNKTANDVDSNCDNLNTMCINTLRKKCHEKGLDFGVSRKEMVELLKNSQKGNDEVETPKK